MKGRHVFGYFLDPAMCVFGGWKLCRHFEANVGIRFLQSYTGDGIRLSYEYRTSMYEIEVGGVEDEKNERSEKRGRTQEAASEADCGDGK